MHIRILTIAFCITALAACSPPAPVQSADSAASVTPQPPVPGGASGASVEPGKWRTTVTILESTIPGAPAAALAAAKAKPFVGEECSTSDDVKEFTRKNLTDEDDGTTCTSNTLTVVNGKISGQSECKDSDGMTRAMTVDGSFTSTHVDMNMSLTGSTPMGPMSQKMHLVADRIGAC